MGEITGDARIEKQMINYGLHSKCLTYIKNCHVEKGLELFMRTQ